LNKIIKKIIALVTICAIALSLGMSGINNDTNNISAESTKEVSVLPVSIPKYVFLFIGDGMSYPQMVTSAIIFLIILFKIYSNLPLAKQKNSFV
jgi:hypothetical protein